MKKFGQLLFLIAVGLIISVPSGICDVSRIEDLNHKNKKIGKYHALVIAIDRYEDSKIPGLSNVTKCAKTFASVLKTRYGFSTEVVLSKNATKANVIKKIENLTQSIGKTGSVIIYFAGRGEVDAAGNESWWYPVDAKSGNYDSYLSCEIIQGAIRNMKAKDVLLISDSGYADAFFGSVHKLPSVTNGKYYTGLFNKRSRWGVTSGNDYPNKGKARGCSTFSSEIVQSLEANSDPQFSVLQLFQKIKKTIRKKASRPPRCRSLKNTGDRGGELVFVLKDSALAKNKKLTADAAKTKNKNGKKVAAQPEKRIGESFIHLTSNVRGSVVVMDGVTIGKTPLKKYAVQTGSHKISVSKDGYLPFSKNVLVKRGALVNVVATLEKKKAVINSGRLFLDVVPADASIRFQGKDLKFTQGMTIDKGAYKIEVSSRYFDKKIIDVDVKPAVDNRSEVKLTPVKSINLKSVGKFVVINPGTFNMGSPDGETMRNPNETQHKVTLSKRIYMQNKETTVAQWRKFIKSTRYKTEAEAGSGAYILVDYNWEKDSEYSWGIPGFPQGDDHPVVAISWNDAQAYIKWLNKKIKGRLKFRLPTEAEWEYACRSGNKEAFYTGECITRNEANYDGNSKWNFCSIGVSSKGTEKGGEFVTNAWGLHDMHGNTKEWCSDWYGNYPSEDVTDPSGPASGSSKVVRGGGWTDYIYNIRSAKRTNKAPDASYSDTGFRLVLDVQ